MQISQMAERPPLVSFEVRPQEYVNAEGERGFRDVDFAIITPPGGNLVVERAAAEWLQQLREKGSPFYDHFKRGFEAWKEGQEPPVDGTAFHSVTFLTPAEVKQVQAAGVRSVEDLAAFPDGQITRLGMGGRRYKDKARAWLETKNSTGQIAEQLAALRVQVEQLAKDNDELRTANRQMKAELDGDKPKRRKSEAA